MSVRCTRRTRRAQPGEFELASSSDRLGDCGAVWSAGGDHRIAGRAAGRDERRLLPGQPATALAVYRGVAVGVEHIGRTFRGPGGERLRHRHVHRRLRMDRRFLSGSADRAVPAVLHAQPHLHGAGVSGAALQRAGAAAVLGADDRALDPDQDLDLAVGVVDCVFRSVGVGQGHGDLGAGAVYGAVHDEGRVERGGLHGRLADDDPAGRGGGADRDRAGPRGGLAGAACAAAGGDVQHGEAGHARGRAVARDVHRRLSGGQLLLVDGPGAGAARVRSAGPQRGPAGGGILRIPEGPDAVSAGACRD